MQISTKKLPKSVIEITIEADEKELQSARKQAIAQLAKEIKIDGFRDGKASEEAIIQKVGEEVVERETSDIAIRLLYTEAVTKEHLKVVSRPEVEVISQKPFKFKAKVAILPEVEIGDYKKIKLKKEKVKVEKKEIENVIAEIKKNNAEAKEVKDRKAKNGDRVEVDFDGFTPDGVPLDGTKSKNHPIVLGEGNFIPGFEEGIIDMGVGEEKEHPVKFPDNYQAKHLAGKDVKFKIKLHKIEELNPPELNDEFAKKISGGQKTKWKEIESDIETHLKSKKDNDQKQKLENDLVNELLKISKVEIPDSLIDEEVEFMLKDLKKRLAGGGLEWDKYLEQTKKTEENIRKELGIEGEKRVKIRLILDKLVELEKITISDSEVSAEIEKTKKLYPEAEQKKIDEAYAAGTSNRLRLQQQLKIIKLLGQLIEQLAK